MSQKQGITNRLQSRLLLGLLMVTVLAVASVLMHRLHKQEIAADDAVKTVAPSLPPDVEGVMTSFSFSESAEDAAVKISGKSVIRRGRRLLGMRSNLVKTNFIEDLSGSFRTANGVTSFRADQAEWEGQSARPLYLKKGVSISIDGKSLPQVKQATIHLARRIIEVDNGKSYSIK